jgi:hypothetical protein
MSKNYPYHQNIKSPSQLGASTKGDMPTLEKNIEALQDYVGVLVSGHTKANVGREPLGNKYFMDTTGTCMDETNTEQKRYVYINNIPDGDIPLISSAMGQSLTQFEGLVPGILEDISYINPAKLFTAFTESNTCQQIIMETKDTSNNIMTESQYVTNDDIKDYNPCWFPNKKNPVTNVSCKEGMTNPPDVILYFVGLGGLGLYLMYKLLNKRL